MDKVIEAIKSTIKCDTPSCDYELKIQVGTEKNYVGISCPRCGANLLSQEDFDNQAAFMALINTVNELARQGVLGNIEAAEQPTHFLMHAIGGGIKLNKLQDESNIH